MLQFRGNGELNWTIEGCRRLADVLGDIEEICSGLKRMGGACLAKT
jgi:hypothetical protein